MEKVGVGEEGSLRRRRRARPPGRPRIPAPALPPQTPALILYGELDRIPGRESLRQLRQIPRHTVVTLRDAGHACYLHKPRDFHQVLLHFLRRLH